VPTLTLGETEHAYSARETPMLTYLNLDSVLEERRKEAAAAGASGDGPRIALAGVGTTLHSRYFAVALKTFTFNR
jgi:hypothetical protein